MPDAGGPDPSRYADVVAAGDLRTARQDRFDATGVPLRARHVASPGWVKIGAIGIRP